MSDFALDMKRFASNTKVSMRTVTRKVALEIFRGVVMKTPVDTGRAKGNWQVSIGTPATGIAEWTDKTPEGHLSSESLAKITREVESWDGAKVAIYLSNNLAYIERLENGYSGQSPTGMVRVTLREYPGIVQRAAGEAV